MDTVLLLDHVLFIRNNMLFIFSGDCHVSPIKHILWAAVDDLIKIISVNAQVAFLKWNLSGQLSRVFKYLPRNPVVCKRPKVP